MDVKKKKEEKLIGGRDSTTRIVEQLTTELANSKESLQSRTESEL